MFLELRTIAFLAVVQLTSHAQIEPVLQPLGLKPGDRYRLIFVTSQQRDALSSNIEDYNEFVQSVADASPVVGSWGLDWKALASTEAVNATDNVGLNKNVLPIYKIDGTQWNTRGSNPFGGAGNPQVLAVEFTELGTIPPRYDDSTNSGGFRGAAVWTGTGPDGLAGNAFGILGGVPRGNATIGDAAQGTGRAYASGSERVTFAAHLYAISAVITVVPEPTGILLLVSGAVGFFVMRRRLRPASRQVAP